VIQDRVSILEIAGKVIGKKYGESDDWIIVLDTLDNVFYCINEILEHNTKYNGYENIPLEIALGIETYDELAQFTGKNLIIETPTINFLKSNIVASYRDFYKATHDRKSIKNTFIVLTSALYDELHPIDKKACKEIKSNKSKQKSFYVEDVNVFRILGKMSKFLDLIGYPRSELYGRIFNKFVPPLEYEKILKTLANKRFVIITGIGEVGKTYTSINLLWDYYTKGYNPIWISGGELHERIDVRKKLENIEDKLTPKNIIYFEDPFGKIKYEKRENLEREIGSIIQNIKQVEDVFVIITSREETFKEFLKEKSSAISLEDFENKLNIIKPSYDNTQRKEILLNWANQQDCKWLKNSELKGFILKSLENTQVLPTPLSIKDFSYSTQDIDNEEEIKKILNEKSKETARAFAAEIQNYTRDKILFLFIPLIWNHFESSFIREVYDELVKELNLVDAWEFVIVLKWFKDDKINLKDGKYVEFSHPSYFKALEYFAFENEYPTISNSEVFSKLIINLSHIDESANQVAWFISWYFNKLPEDVRNELLVNLSKKDVTAQYNSMALARNFDIVPVDIRNKILESGSNKVITAKHYILSLSKYFNHVPQKIRDDLLLKASEEQKGYPDASDIISDNIIKFKSTILIKLLKNSTKFDNSFKKIAHAIVKKI